MVLFRRGRFIRKPFAGKGIVQPFQQLGQAADGAACFTVAEGKQPRFAEKQFTRRLTAESDAAEFDGLCQPSGPSAICWRMASPKVPSSCW